MNVALEMYAVLVPIASTYYISLTSDHYELILRLSSRHPWSEPFTIGLSHKPPSLAERFPDKVLFFRGLP